MILITKYIGNMNSMFSLVYYLFFCFYRLEGTSTNPPMTTVIMTWNNNRTSSNCYISWIRRFFTNFYLNNFNNIAFVSWVNRSNPFSTIINSSFYRILSWYIDNNIRTRFTLTRNRSITIIYRINNWSF